MIQFQQINQYSHLKLVIFQCVHNASSYSNRFVNIYFQWHYDCLAEFSPLISICPSLFNVLFRCFHSPIIFVPVTWSSPLVVLFQLCKILFLGPLLYFSPFFLLFFLGCISLCRSIELVILALWYKLNSEQLSCWLQEHSYLSLSSFTFKSNLPSSFIILPRYTSIPLHLFTF